MMITAAVPNLNEMIVRQKCRIREKKGQFTFRNRIEVFGTPNIFKPIHISYGGFIDIRDSIVIFYPNRAGRFSSKSIQEGEKNKTNSKPETY